MKIAVFPNPARDPEMRVTSQLILLIHEFKAEAVIEADYVYNLDPKLPFTIAPYQDCDLLICLGGDGTFLSTVHLNLGLPSIGVNLGTVGFLPEIEVADLRESVALLVAGKYTIQERMLLDLEYYDQNGQKLGFFQALNDVVAMRGGSSRILSIDLFINEVLVGRIPGDGIIVASPTGSTAYSMSAGGPIVDPELDSILITPISPHSLHNRTYVLAPRSQVRLKICDYPEMAVLAIDGRNELDLFTDYEIRVKTSQRRFRLINLEEERFYKSFPEKIIKRGINR